MALAELVKRLFGFAPEVGEQPRPVNHHAARTEAGRWQKALSDFGYPYQLVSAGTIEATFRAEQELATQEGFSPIIIAPGLWNSTPISAEERTRRALASISERYDAAFGRAFLADRFSNMRRDLDSDPDAPDLHVFEDLQPVAASPRAPGLLLPRRYDPVERTMQPLEAVAIMRIPTAHSAWIPAYLDWGGWNAVPTPLEIAAVARHWAETHGATLVAMTSDQLEFAITKRPSSHSDAVALLKEHYAFAPDTYELDQDMLQQAAAELQVVDSWTFWWD
jgi:hypothetical protein